jgi:hypothetical protein
MERHADFRLPTPPFKSGGDDLGIIDNQNIIRKKQCWHIANMAVGNVITRQVEQTGRFAWNSGFCGNFISRKAVVKGIELHNIYPPKNQGL